MSRPAAAVHRVIKAYDVRGLVGEEIDESFVADIGAAFARLMRAEGARQAVIGYDMRDSSPSLAAAFAAGVTGQGLDVVRIGLASTDQLYFAPGLLDCPGAMFTASHNPAAYNGIKLCRAGAKPVGADTGLRVISEDMIAGIPADATTGHRHHRRPRCAGRIRRVPAFAGGHLRAAPAAGGRGRRERDGRSHRAGGARCDRLDHLLPLYFELDGSFPNHEANPLNPANLVDLQTYVLDTGADIGLAFDGDADRCFVIDERGRPVSPSTVTSLVAARELHREIGATRHPQRDHVTGGARVGSRARRHAGALAGRALLHQGADGRHRRDLRRRAFGALLLPRLLGRRLRDAGRAARAGRPR